MDLSSLGHHFILSCSGSSLTDDERALFRELKPAGLFLWGASFAKEQGYPAWTEKLADLIQEVHQLTGREKMIVCIDHEGGRVTRTPKPVTVTPAAGEYAPYADIVGAIHGEELATLGVNLTFGPVADIFSNPVNPVIGPRSFGSDAASVTEAARSYINSVRAHGVEVCPKHFPGHGDVSSDTHFGFVRVEADAATIRERELAPFRALINNPGVAAIMTAHVCFPAIDAVYPATLSREFLRGVLRQELGFSGVIVSDDVDMEAIRTSYSDDECAVLLREAGVDVILFNHKPQRAVTFARVLSQALASGRLVLDDEQRSRDRVEAFLQSLPQSKVSARPQEFFTKHTSMLEAAVPLASSSLLLRAQEPKPRRLAPPSKPFDVRVGVVTADDNRQKISFIPESDSLGKSSNYKEFLFKAGERYTVRVVDHELFLEGGSFRVEKLVGNLVVIHPAGAERRAGAGIKVSPLVAGRHFHWKKEIECSFCGTVEIHPAQDRLLVINSVDFETYIACVVGSEMSGRGLPVEFSKAQATAARSWAYTFLGTKYPGKPYAICNDDMSQRYQGTTFLEQRLFDDLEPCRGRYLVDGEGYVVPAFYSKSTGGHGEHPDQVFGFAVSGIGASYDAPADRRPTFDLSNDEGFASWVSDDSSWRGKGVFCSPEVVPDAELGRFLGAVDSVAKYFRWHHTSSSEQILRNLSEKCDVRDAAALLEVIWGPRGVSGRYLSATLVYQSTQGDVKQLTLPNQFVIRGVFHESFLYSSAFVCDVVRKGVEIDSLTFRGAGWGHGVGLCQIGALGMALGSLGIFEPQPYEAILAHYFSEASLSHV